MSGDYPGLCDDSGMVSLDRRVTVQDFLRELSDHGYLCDYIAQHKLCSAEMVSSALKYAAECVAIVDSDREEGDPV